MNWGKVGAFFGRIASGAVLNNSDAAASNVAFAKAVVDPARQPEDDAITHFDDEVNADVAKRAGIDE